MTAWSGEDDRYITNDKDTWKADFGKDTDKDTVDFKTEETVVFEVLNSEVTKDYLEGVADALEACALSVGNPSLRTRWLKDAEKQRERARDMA